VLRIAGENGRVPRGLGGSMGVHGGRRWKGADRPRRRARGIGVVRREKEKGQENFAHHAKELQRRSRARMEQ
jgi:hypothetical protein